MKVTIVVAHHKKGYVYKNNVFLPIQVGASLSKEKLDMQGDNVGDNISNLNPYYSEMSAMYWLWKNSADADYCGLCHYRRYFTFKKINIIGRMLHGLFYGFFRMAILFRKNINYTESHVFITPTSNINKELDDFTEKLYMRLQKKPSAVFCLKDAKLSGKTIFHHLAQVTGMAQIQKLKDIIEKKFPEYSLYLEKCLNGSKYSFANMVIMPKCMFNEYCEFVFGVLEEHLQFYISQGDINKCYLRFSGYFAEILTDIFMKKKLSDNHNVIRLNSIFVDDKKNAKVRLLNKIGFFHPYLTK